MKTRRLPKPSLKKVEQGFRLVLEGLGLDPEGVHTKDTPVRAAKAWWWELCAGLTLPPPEMRTFTSSVDEMIVLRGIPVRSLCAHHLLPFIGEATIGYVPARNQILGLSKLSRLTDHWARRPQVQEELTAQIADALASLVVDDRHTPPKGGVGVTIRANHLCMQVRGVNHSGDMVTSALRGVFQTNPAARAEFLSLTQTGGAHA